jgi:hypothetical protein
MNFGNLTKGLTDKVNATLVGPSASRPAHCPLPRARLNSSEPTWRVAAGKCSSSFWEQAVLMRMQFHPRRERRTPRS